MNETLSIYQQPPISRENAMAFAQVARLGAAVNRLNELGIKVIGMHVSAASGMPDVQVVHGPECAVLCGVIYRTSGRLVRSEVYQANLHGCRVRWLVSRCPEKGAER